MTTTKRNRSDKRFRTEQTYNQLLMTWKANKSCRYQSWNLMLSRSGLGRNSLITTTYIMSMIPSGTLEWVCSPRSWRNLRSWHQSWPSLSFLRTPATCNLLIKVTTIREWDFKQACLTLKSGTQEKSSTMRCIGASSETRWSRCCLPSITPS